MRSQFAPKEARKMDTLLSLGVAAFLIAALVGPLLFYREPKDR